MIVAGRLAYVNHLPAADASYHHQCSSSFCSAVPVVGLKGGGGGGQMPIRHTHVEAAIYHIIIRRSELEVKILTVATYLEETDEQMTVGDLIGKKKRGNNTYMVLNNMWPIVCCT